MRVKKYFLTKFVLAGIVFVCFVAKVNSQESLTAKEAFKQGAALMEKEHYTPFHS